MTQTLDGFGSTALHSRPRRRWLIVSVLGSVVLLVLATAAALALRTRDADSRRMYLSTNGWPERGQGAYQLGGGQPAASPRQHPVPIASLAKVMTALVVLQHLPLDGTADGPHSWCVPRTSLTRLGGSTAMNRSWPWALVNGSPNAKP